MSKLLPNIITKVDVEKYMSNFSDFSFELKVLNKFVELGYECKHGGTYEDPVTNKSREFDIRALKEIGKFRINLSVECKNIQQHFPLVVHCTERNSKESFNELIYTFPPRSSPQKYGGMTFSIKADDVYSETLRLERICLYPSSNLVARSTDQIGRRQDGEITSNDSNVFEKISQAINSSKDLIEEAHSLNPSQFFHCFTLICPVLVIPDNCLWQIKYAANGELVGEPELVSHISYFIDKKWSIDEGMQWKTYTMSHLEFITISEIPSFTSDYLEGYINRCIRSIDHNSDLS